MPSCAGAGLAARGGAGALSTLEGALSALAVGVSRLVVSALVADEEGDEHAATPAKRTA
jgi:hypothetical protein